MDEYPFKSAVDLVKAIKGKKISSSELLEIYIERYKRFNPLINAIVFTDLENARAKAKKADEALARGEDWGVLHGLPVTIKDSFEVVGMPCTSGSPELKDYMPTNNAVVVDALLKAGAIVFGKTNLPRFAMDIQSYNDVYGQTNNPWDVSKTPGGSSGGGAAALASGLTCLEVGSDNGGSLRNPPHFCGVCGHKPTFNLVPLRGHVPPLPGLFPGGYTGDGDIGVAGPMARNVEDLELAMKLLVQPKVFQKPAWKFTLPKPRRENLKSYRIASWLDDPAFTVDGQVGDRLQAAVDELLVAGATIKEKKPDIDFTECHAIYSKLLAASTSPMLPQEDLDYAISEKPKLDEMDLGFRAQWIRGATIAHREWLVLDYLRLMMRQKWADFFKDFDALMCPVIPVTAFPHDHSEYMDRTLIVNGKARSYPDTYLPWAGLTCVSYLPSTVVQVGLAQNGLPVGMQIVGPYLEDRTALHVAKLVEKTISGFTPPPGFE